MIRSIYSKCLPERQPEFSIYKEGDTAVIAHLRHIKRCFNLDTLLRLVDIPKIKVKWTNDSPEAAMPKPHERVGNYDYCLIFYCLKNEMRVDRVIELKVDDFAGKDHKAHSDAAIEKCLTGLKIDIWNWKRLDISSEVIRRSVGSTVKKVFLYCSGNNAILRSWADCSGLINLEKVGTAWST
jgi:hypothetical protein